MFDQLRWDYLSCAGHPHLHTPNIDAWPQKACVLPAPIANPCVRRLKDELLHRTLLSFPWGHMEPCPLRSGNILGDHLRDNGMECWLVGKTHMKADTEGMARLGILLTALLVCAPNNADLTSMNAMTVCAPKVPMDFMMTVVLPPITNGFVNGVSRGQSVA